MRWAILWVLLVAAIPVAAHHSFAAVYDESKPLKVDGVVWEIDWKNPHVQIVMVGKDGDGGNQRWTFEMGAPMVLIRDFGWTPDTVKVGDRITLEGFHARAGGEQAAAVSIVTRTGARLRAVRPFR